MWSQSYRPRNYPSTLLILWQFFCLLSLKFQESLFLFLVLFTVSPPVQQLSDQSGTTERFRWTPSAHVRSFHGDGFAHCWRRFQKHLCLVRDTANYMDFYLKSFRFETSRNSDKRKTCVWLVCTNICSYQQNKLCAINKLKEKHHWNASRFTYPNSTSILAVWTIDVAWPNSTCNGRKTTTLW